MTKKKKNPRKPLIPPNKRHKDKRRKLQDLLDKITPENCHHITHSMASDDCPYPELW